MTPGPYSTLAPRREALGLRGSGRGSHLPTQGHTAGKWQSQADPTATEIPPEALLLEDFHDGEMGWLRGLSKSCTPILTGSAQWFPVWVSLGGSRRLFGGAPRCLQSFEIHDGRYAFTKGLQRTSHSLALAGIHSINPRCPSDSPGWWELSRDQRCP